MFPVVTVAGGPRERGVQYGEQAGERIQRSITAYDETYRYFAGWDWGQATELAMRFLPRIEAFAPDIAEELRGMAEGAGVAIDDILALNVRTEIMYSARIRNALTLDPPAECSVFSAVAPDHPVIVGQNWDWATFAMDTVVVVQSTPDDGLAYLTVVEAGLLAKFGVNSAGLAVMTNALACTEDVGDPGVPYHVVLRSLLQCGSTKEAVARLESAERSSSANYLLADPAGDTVDIEARPGGADRLHFLHGDDDGVLLHTNHFVSPEFDSVDYARLVQTTTDARMGRLVDVVAAAEDPADLDLFRAALTDHTNEPNSVCRHPDLSLPGPDQSMTVSSVLVDLTARRVWVSEGPPCEPGYEELDTSVVWG